MNALLKQKLNTIISDSKVFKLMSETDQSALIASFETASDDQLAQAIAVLESQEKRFNEGEQARLRVAQDQIAAAEALHSEIKSAEHLVMVVAEEDEQASSMKQLAEIEKSIGLPASDQKSSNNPKKFFGLF